MSKKWATKPAGGMVWIGPINYTVERELDTEAGILNILELLQDKRDAVVKPKQIVQWTKDTATNRLMEKKRDLQFEMNSSFAVAVFEKAEDATYMHETWRHKEHHECDEIARQILPLGENRLKMEPLHASLLPLSRPRHPARGTSSSLAQSAGADGIREISSA